MELPIGVSKRDERKSRTGWGPAEKVTVVKFLYQALTVCVNRARQAEVVQYFQTIRDHQFIGIPPYSATRRGTVKGRI